MKIDFVSDIACPWCAIGLQSLLQAIGRFEGRLPVELRFQPFELNPQVGPEGEDLVAHLADKYGISAEQVAQNHTAIAQRFEALGLPFRTDGERRIHNTFDAHRLLHWAELQGRALPLKQALFRAYFGEARNPADAATLVELAMEAGLDARAAAEVLASGAYADEVRERERWYLERGISSVPSIIIDDQHLIQGGQPPDVFERALRQIGGRA